jgi:hypothetical protein
MPTPLIMQGTRFGASNCQSNPDNLISLGGSFLRQHFSHASKDGVQVMFQVIVHFIEARAGANK